MYDEESLILFRYCLWLCLLYPCIVMDSAPFEKDYSKVQVHYGHMYNEHGIMEKQRYRNGI